MSRSARTNGSQGRLLPVFSPLDLNQRSKGEAVLCEIIQFKTRARTQLPMQGSLLGVIDVYPDTNGKTGIDACVPAALGMEILSEMHTATDLHVFQQTEGGMVGIDAQFPASVAAEILAKAKWAGVSIRR